MVSKGDFMQLTSKIIDLQLHKCIREHQLTMEYYDIKIKRLLRLKSLAEANKPLHLFKKKYKKWEKAIIDYDNQIKELYKQKEMEFKSIQNISNNIKS